MTNPPQPQAPGVATDDRAAGRARFRATLAKVMAVQVVSLLLLWWLQAAFTR